MFKVYFKGEDPFVYVPDYFRLRDFGVWEFGDLGDCSYGVDTEEGLFVCFRLAQFYMFQDFLRSEGFSSFYLFLDAKTDEMIAEEIADFVGLGLGLLFRVFVRKMEISNHKRGYRFSKKYQDIMSIIDAEIHKPRYKRLMFIEDIEAAFDCVIEEYEEDDDV